MRVPCAECVYHNLDVLAVANKPHLPEPTVLYMYPVPEYSYIMALLVIKARLASTNFAICFLLAIF